MSAPEHLEVAVADAAAHAAGVTVRELVDLAELEAVVELFAEVWGRSASPPMSVELLRAFTKAGNYVGGAFDDTLDGRLVGACVGFFHAPGHGALHSHIAGVTVGGRSIGYALKLHQRSWALERGVREIIWTFDPLVARNAWFNLAKLGARVTEYLPNFYGPMLDDRNGRDDTDRLLVRWTLLDPAVEPPLVVAGDARAELAAGAVVALGTGPGGEPEPGCLDGAVALVAVPPDIERLRVTDPDLALRWRLAVRASLGELLAAGGRVEGFDRAGWYVVRSAR